MKKYIKIIFGILLLILFLIIRIRNLPVPESIKNMVYNSKEDYETIAKICYADYQNHSMNKLIYICGKYGIYCQECDHDITLNISESVSYQNLYESFKLDGNYLDFMCVYDTFVSFGTVDGVESIVYSVYDTRPSYINSPDEKNRKVAVRKITKYWYYVYDIR